MNLLRGLSLASSCLGLLTPVFSDSVFEVDAYDTARSIASNVGDFVDGYNQKKRKKDIQFDPWRASEIELQETIFDIDTGKEFVLIDFDGDNGYAVADANRLIKEIVTNGDLTPVACEHILYWSEYDGVIYQNEDGDYVRASQTYLTEEDNNKIAYQNKGYKYGFISGSDCIGDPLEYLHSRYGGDWEYIPEESNIINSYKNVRRNDYAIYQNEGNCTLSAYFGIFRYLRDFGYFNDFPDYEDYITSDETIGNPIYDQLCVPEIYKVLLECASNYDYTYESSFATSLNRVRWGEEAIEKLGYYSNQEGSYIHRKLIWSFEKQVKETINGGYPTRWNQARGNYGAHSRVVKGYRMFRCEEPFLWWTNVDKKPFRVVNDNWDNNYEDSFIDFDGYSSDLIHEGFGTFVTVKDYHW